MKRKYKAFLTAALTALVFLLCPAEAAAEEPEMKALESSDTGAVLEDRCVYRVLEDTVITNSVPGGAGITVPENAEVCIFVKDGATLTVTGGGGLGRLGGGAGILVPASSTLILTGGGTVLAAGGSAGDGGDGGDGSDGIISMEGNYYFGGKGGRGGDGGGGAGAGIGTNGGTGAEGSEQNSYTYLYRRVDEGFGLYLPEFSSEACLCETDAGDTCGTDGVDGEDGKAAAAPGTVLILGTVSVIAESGSAGGTGTAGNSGSGVSSEGFGWANFYTAGGGGAGGAGHGGYEAASGIGPGGSGGGAGGQGGSGGTHCSSEGFSWLTGGPGGSFDDAAGSGLSAEDPVILSGVWGGFGGSGGGPSQRTASFTLEIEKETQVEGAPESAVRSYFDPADPRASLIACSVTYRDGGSLLFAGTETGQFVHQYLYGETLTLPKTADRQGYVFGGWFRDSGCLDGPETVIDYQWGTGEQIVYAKWTDAAESGGDSEETQEGLSRSMKLALIVTGAAVALSFAVFAVLEHRRRSQVRSRKVRR